ncbi:hypothetical protein BKA81DRAFT_186267 [Phyllosticta paracitricarpa]|uniref:Uncharacterized protein n=1 Tax=Phyllosticta paracitricarpa TaxID=2016321 RepID=A0ABR1MW87_9PEZI
MGAKSGRGAWGRRSGLGDPKHDITVTNTRAQSATSNFNGRGGYAPLASFSSPSLSYLSFIVLLSFSPLLFQAWIIIIIIITIFSCGSGYMAKGFLQADGREARGEDCKRVYGGGFRGLDWNRDGMNWTWG